MALKKKALIKKTLNKIQITGLLTALFVFLFCPAVYAGQTDYAERFNVTPNISVEIDMNSESFFLFEHVRLVVETEDGTYVFFDETIPPVLCMLLFAAIRIAVMSCVYFIKRAFFEQGAMALKKRPFRVAGNGLVTYVALAGLIIMFLFSIVAAPLSALFFLCILALSVCGEISAALLLGSLVRPTKKTFSYANLQLGAIIIEGAGCLPFIGWLFRLVIFPIACVGTAVSCLIDGFINKMYYEIT